MEREILFRGKHVGNGEWVYGSSLKEKACDGVQHIIVTENGEYYLINPKTAGQYTNLTDKNGVKIFEGDIVNVKTVINGSFINYVIAWLDSDLCWVMQSLKDTSVKIRLRSCWEFEVVDNIHDNPELLKGESKCANISE